MINMILDDASDRMQKAIEAYQRDLATVRTGRATPAMLDRVMVNYYGSPTPINQMAGVSVVEGRQLVIKPYDKSALKDIEHGIYEADLGLTPQNDGEIIRITVPALTEERRKEYAKNVWKFAEHAKVAIRNIRRDANDEIKKCDGSEDEIKDGQNRVQKLTDKFVKEVDEIGKVKEKDRNIDSNSTLLHSDVEEILGERLNKANRSAIAKMRSLGMTDEAITATAHYAVGHAKSDSRGYVPYFMTVLRERLKNGVLTAANLSRLKEQSRPKQEDSSGYLSPTNIGGTERQQDDSQLSDWEREWKNRVMNRSKENSNDD